MELKVPHFAAVISFGVVSIAPLWNWKSQSRMPVSLSICFNRTFMELKGCPAAICGRGCQGFNRTFMELKGRWYTSRSRLSPVSIAPLWNWKVCCQQVQRVQCWGFNRTFMELKDAQGCYLLSWSTFQSHLYGIERRFINAWMSRPTLFQSHLYGIEREKWNKWWYVRTVSIAPLWNWKASMLRTFAAVIPFQSHLYGIESAHLLLSSECVRWFQSHLYGIESNVGSWLRVATTLFQSHLYGIERRLQWQPSSSN